MLKRVSETWYLPLVPVGLDLELESVFSEAEFIATRFNNMPLTPCSWWPWS